MAEEPKVESIAKHFGKVKDPRVEQTKRYKLLDILLIAICGVICGADSWVDIEMFGKSKLVRLKTFLTLPNVIPSQDTFGRVFALINPEEFERSYMEWVEAINELPKAR